MRRYGHFDFVVVVISPLAELSLVYIGLSGILVVVKISGTFVGHVCQVRL